MKLKYFRGTVLSRHHRGGGQSSTTTEKEPASACLTSLKQKQFDPGGFKSGTKGTSVRVQLLLEEERSKGPAAVPPVPASVHLST